MRPHDRATLHLRVSGPSVSESIASGTMIGLVDRVMNESLKNRQLLVIRCGDMQYRAAEIQNLAGQHEFDQFCRDSSRPKLPDPRRAPPRSGDG